MSRLTESPAWQALVAHRAEMAGPRCATCSRRIRSASRSSRSVWTTCCSTTRRTGSPTRRCGSSGALAEQAEPPSAASTPCSPARRSTAPRTARCCTSRCATAPNRPILVDGRDVMPEVNARARPRCATFADGRAQRRLAGVTRASRSRTSSTSASAAPTSGPSW